MTENTNDGFVRADQIDLKSLDEQLERHLNRAWTMEKNKKKQEFDDFAPATAAAATYVSATNKSKQRQEWEIDPSKLIIKSVLARGTFGTVHRGIYDGLDVAEFNWICFKRIFYSFFWWWTGKGGGAWKWLWWVVWCWLMTVHFVKWVHRARDSPGR